MIRATYRPVEGGKGFELLLGEYVLGQTKLECDAQLHARRVDDAITDAYDEGYTDGKTST